MPLSPKIIYGTAWKKEQTASLVVTAVLQGFRAIDTACQPKHYREDLVGEALVELQEKHGIQRNDLFLQTKFTTIAGQDTTKPIPYNPSDSVTQQVLTSYSKSLSNLHTTYLDSYLLHSPLPTLTQTLEAWTTLADLQDQGKVHLIGVSNTYDVQTLAALQKVRKVQVVQNRWYEKNLWDKSVVNYCLEHGIMYQSFWTLTGSPTLLYHPSLTSIAEASGLTDAQTVYKIAQLNGVTPLSGTTDKLHMQQDVEVEKSNLSLDGLEQQYKMIESTIRG